MKRYEAVRFDNRPNSSNGRVVVRDEVYTSHDEVIVETKTIEKISDNERGQVINYLRITGLRVGVILNFKHARLEWERIVL